MSERPLILAVVLNWRTPDLTIRCVDALLTSDLPNARLQVLVVDNSSGDGSEEVIRERYGDRIEVVESPVNNGYAGGMNIGLARAVETGARYAFLLNSDVEVNRSTVSHLFDAAEAIPDGAFFGPRIFDAGKPADCWFVGGRWDWGQGTIRVVRERSTDNLPEEPRLLEFVNGAAMFVRISVLPETGVFDERFGLYFEESDLCSRACAAGFTLWHVPRASVLHVCGASTSKSSGLGGVDVGQYYRTRNRFLWGRNNTRGFRAAVFWANALIRTPFKAFFLAVGGRLPSARGVLLGMRDFALGRLGMFQGR